ncbi:MAG UNVERIFIED_CONTAM: hypothetical protein LVR18_12110 [Planctomycetaceae bacterium]|jgi:hypothetical protein
MSLLNPAALFLLLIALPITLLYVLRVRLRAFRSRHSCSGKSAGGSASAGVLAAIQASCQLACDAAPAGTDDSCRQRHSYEQSCDAFAETGAGSRRVVQHGSGYARHFATGYRTSGSRCSELQNFQMTTKLP